jgi:hypothetical protein
MDVSKFDLLESITIKAYNTDICIRSRVDTKKINLNLFFSIFSIRFQLRIQQKFKTFNIYPYLQRIMHS